jgi:hypothetical protein
VPRHQMGTMGAGLVLSTLGPRRLFEPDNEAPSVNEATLDAGAFPNLHTAGGNDVTRAGRLLR